MAEKLCGTRAKLNEKNKRRIIDNWERYRKYKKMTYEKLYLRQNANVLKAILN